MDYIKHDGNSFITGLRCTEVAPIMSQCWKVKMTGQTVKYGISQELHNTEAELKLAAFKNAADKNCLITSAICDEHDYDFSNVILCT